MDEQRTHLIPSWLVVAPLALHAVTMPRLGILANKGGVAELALASAALLLVVSSGVRLARDSLRVAACTLLLLPSLPFAHDPRAATFQWLVFLYVGGLFALGAELGRRGFAVPAISALVAGGALVSALGIFGVVADLSLGTSFGLARSYEVIVTGPRATGPTETPTMLGLVAGTSLVGLLALVRREAISRRNAILVAFVLVVALVLTRSRPLLDLLAALPIVAWLAGVEREQRWAIASVGACAAVLLVLTLVFRFLPLRPAPPFFDTHPSLYAICHDVALRAFASHPFAGVGLEGFSDAWPSLLDPSRYVSHLEGVFTVDELGSLDPHSTYLGFLAEAGLFGAAYLAMLAFVLLRRVDRHVPELALLLGFAALAGLHADVATNRGIALLAGVLTGLPGPEVRRSRAAPRRT